jgi:NADH dehydrogenase [ubiquinone] 1 alpha subcomplex assembly factor 7
MLCVWCCATMTTRPRGEEEEEEEGAGPHDYAWLECGPGRGTLMADVIGCCLRLAATQDPHAAAFGRGCRRVHLIEASPVLRQLQKETLTENLSDQVEFQFDNDEKKKKTSPAKNADENPNNNNCKRVISVHWHDSLAAFEQWQQQQEMRGHKDVRLPVYCICQEFLDALPVYSFEKTPEGFWRERLVDVAVREDLLHDDEDDVEPIERTAKTTGVDSSENQQHPQQEKSLDQQKKPRLRIVLAPEVTPALKTLLPVDAEGRLPDDDASPVGSVVEVNPEACLLVQDLAHLVEKQGGACLVIDYGSDQGSTDSVRGFSKHKQVHFLSRPGLVDVTADVDFAALRHAVNHQRQQQQQQESNDASSTTTNVRAFGPVTQGEFLVAMGIQERVINHIEKDETTDEEAEDLYESMVRLASPEHMGQRFKVMAIVKAGSSDEAPPGF